LISAIFFIEPKLSKEEGIEAFAAILNAIKFFLVSMGENLKCKKEINKLCEEIKILTCRLQDIVQAKVAIGADISNSIEFTTTISSLRETVASKVSNKTDGSLQLEKLKAKQEAKIMELMASIPVKVDCKVSPNITSTMGRIENFLRNRGYTHAIVGIGSDKDLSGIFVDLNSELDPITLCGIQQIAKEGNSALIVHDGKNSILSRMKEASGEGEESGNTCLNGINIAIDNPQVPPVAFKGNNQ